MADEKKVLLKVKHVDVKFRVRGRTLNAIRDANLEIFDHETIAIVGESGSGKSVLTKTFAGMLDPNGFISHGNIYFYDDDISYTEVAFNRRNRTFFNYCLKKITEYSYLSYGKDEYNEIRNLKAEIEKMQTTTPEKEEEFEKKAKEINDKSNDIFNERATLKFYRNSDRPRYIALTHELNKVKREQRKLDREISNYSKHLSKEYKKNSELVLQHNTKLRELEEIRQTKIRNAEANELTEIEKQNAFEIANEIVLSIGRYPLHLLVRYALKLLKGFKVAYSRGLDMSTEKQRRRVFEPILFRVEYRNIITKETSDLKSTIDQEFAPKFSADIVEDENLANETLIEQARQLHPHLRKHMVKVITKMSEANGYDGVDDIENVEKIADIILLKVGQFDSTIHANYFANKVLKWLKGVYDSKKKNVASDSIRSKPQRTLVGFAYIDCAKVKYTKDWEKIRGCKIATVFQDPMTSLNPILTIGKQIMLVIQKHQKCSAFEAKRRAIVMMQKVGIPDAEKRFDDYPFQYSGGMRQRIVIAIALSCQPKILICDEPTTALDVTIQAQIIRLIKKLSKDLGFATVYITHDLGVVANVADRVAVLYGGQIVELGDVEDIFYDPRHPYTWALLSSMPQLGNRGEELFSIPGTPPSLYTKIVGDAFAPRSSYALAIDFVKEPPMFEVNEHHWAKTWLLDPRAPKVEKPKSIQNLHEKMVAIYKDK